MTNLNSFYQRLQNARPATDINPEGKSGLDKDHFALIQEHLFYAEIIFDDPTQLINKFMGQLDNSDITLPSFFNKPNKNIYNLYAEQFIIPLSIRSVTLPNASTNASEHEINTDFGKVVFPSKGTLIPDTNILTVQFLNAEQNILEHLIFDWILETKANIWVYDTHPFSRATIRINYLDQKAESIIFSYDFFGAFPLAYDTINSNHVAEPNIERGATFAFNWFNVNHSKRQFVETPSSLNRFNQINDIFEGSGSSQSNRTFSDELASLEDISNIVRASTDNQISVNNDNVTESLQNLASIFPNNSNVV